MLLIGFYLNGLKPVYRLGFDRRFGNFSINLNDIWPIEINDQHTLRENTDRFWASDTSSPSLRVLIAP
jgi:hypothetical protein